MSHLWSEKQLFIFTETPPDKSKVFFKRVYINADCSISFYWSLFLSWRLEKRVVWRDRGKEIVEGIGNLDRM